MIKLNLGSGVALIGGFINVDMAFSEEEIRKNVGKGMFKNGFIQEGAKFVQADICDLPFEDNYADYVESVNVFEHITHWNVEKALSETLRVMKPGAKFRLVVPNMDGMALEWLRMATFIKFEPKYYTETMHVMYGNQIGGDLETHRTAFNVRYLEYLLDKVGFHKFNIASYNIHTPANLLPELETNPGSKDKGGYLRNDTIYAEAYKYEQEKK